MPETNKESNEQITKGDVEDNHTEVEVDLNIIIDPSKDEKSEIKHYGSKLVDTGACPAIS